jgi:hypothetical protein
MPSPVYLVTALICRSVTIQGHVTSSTMGHAKSIFPVHGHSYLARVNYLYSLWHKSCLGSTSPNSLLWPMCFCRLKSDSTQQKDAHVNLCEIRYQGSQKVADGFRGIRAWIAPMGWIMKKTKPANQWPSNCVLGLLLNQFSRLDTMKLPISKN